VRAIGNAFSRGESHRVSEGAVRFEAQAPIFLAVTVQPDWLLAAALSILQEEQIKNPTKRHKFHEENDCISCPKDDGHSSFHLYLSLP
jgi:hypothetical protein